VRCQLWNVVRWVITLLLFFLVGRKPLPSCELVFTASEEAIFVHVLVRRKCVEHLVRHSWFWLDCSCVSLTLNKVFTLCCCVRQWTVQMCQVDIYYLFLFLWGLWEFAVLSYIGWNSKVVAALQESTTVVNHRFASGACPAKVKCVAVWQQSCRFCLRLSILCAFSLHEKEMRWHLLRR
jgi:hypothetical protein